jgi:hypothetical protein
LIFRGLLNKSQVKPCMADEMSSAKGKALPGAIIPKNR